MFSKAKWVMVAVAMAFFMMPNVSEAQWRRGGGGRGWAGGYRGGYWGGAGVGIGIGTGYGYGYPGYYNRGFYGGGYYGSGYYGGLGLYNRGYYSPGYYSSPTYYSNGSTYSSPSVVYNSSTPYGEIVQAGAIVPQDGQFVGGMATSFSTPANTASITVKVPANATLWWNGSPTSIGGDTRYFRTSSLGNDGATQTFRARWSDSTGQPVDLTRQVRVMANGDATIDFTRPDDGSNRPNNNANPVNPNPVNQ